MRANVDDEVVGSVCYAVEEDVGFWGVVALVEGECAEGVGEGGEGEEEEGSEHGAWVVGFAMGIGGG